MANTMNYTGATTSNTNEQKNIEKTVKASTTREPRRSKAALTTVAYAQITKATLDSP